MISQRPRIWFDVIWAYISANITQGINIQIINNFLLSSKKEVEEATSPTGIKRCRKDGQIHKEKELAGLEKSGPDPVSTPTTAPRPKISKLTAARLSAAAKAAKANKIHGGNSRTSDLKGPKLCAHKNNPGLKS